MLRFFVSRPNSAWRVMVWRRHTIVAILNCFLTDLACRRVTTVINISLPDPSDHMARLDCMISECLLRKLCPWPFFIMTMNLAVWLLSPLKILSMHDGMDGGSGVAGARGVGVVEGLPRRAYTTTAR